EDELVNNLENWDEFGCGSRSEDKMVNDLKNKNEFECRLESENELANSLRNENEFENGLESENEVISRLEYSNETRLDIYDDSDNGSESNSDISTTTNRSSTDNEENTPFISAELATIIQLFKIKVQNNLTDEAFYEIVKAVIAKPM
ncbi:31156_t:CDS:2, partial [Racocetra persica]